MNLEQLRAQIDECDATIMQTLDRRIEIVRQVAEFKADNDVEIVQSDRQTQLIQHLQAEFGSANLRPEFIADLYHLIIDYAVNLETEHNAK